MSADVLGVVPPLLTAVQLISAQNLLSIQFKNLCVLLGVLTNFSKPLLDGTNEPPL